jgi:hypothetical protein
MADTRAQGPAKAQASVSVRFGGWSGPSPSSPSGRRCWDQAIARVALEAAIGPPVLSPRANEWLSPL